MSKIKRCGKHNCDYTFNKPKTKQYCKLCKAESDKKYREANKEKIKTRQDKWYIENKERVLEYHHLLYINNREEILIKQKEYYILHKNEINAQSAAKYASDPEYYRYKANEYRKENVESIRSRQKECRQKPERKEYHKNYCKNWSAKRREDPNIKLREQISKEIARALKAANSCKKGHSCLTFLPYSIDGLKSHIESLFEDWMNWENWGVYSINDWDDNDPKTWRWQIDHIIPRSLLIYDSMEHPNFLKCWDLSNLRPLSAKENILKGNKCII